MGLTRERERARICVRKTTKHTDESQEESTCHDAGIALDLAGQSRDKTPYHHASSDVERRSAHVVEHEIGRDLHEEVPDEQDGQTGLIVLIREFEVFHQTL